MLGPGPIRGQGLITSPSPSIPPSDKTIDGDISDWAGEITRLAGTAVYSRGEYVYQDYLMDDRGADDGRDAERLALTGPARDAEPRLYRTEAVFQAANDQLGVSPPVGAHAHYGDAAYPEGLTDHADVLEVRVAADSSDLSFLVRTTGMTEPEGTAVLFLVDTEPGGEHTAPGGLTTGAEHAFVVQGSSCVAGACPEGLAAATNPAGHVNAVEVSVPGGSLAPLPERPRLGVVAGVMDETGFVPFNAAFRFDEPIAIWMDRDQALALHAGDVDRYLAEIRLPRLAGGYTERWEPRPGYYERVYVSDSPVVDEMAVEGGYIQGAFQHYGLYLPTSFRPGREHPATFWMHYRGGRAHDAGAWVPGLIRQLGEDQGNIIVSPGGRGTNHWYVGRAHEDFLEVWDDVMADYPIDPDRVYLSGYSMGGFASYLLGLLYPDRFAAAFPTAGPPTQGAWLGAGDPSEPQQDGRVQEELMFHLIENARNLPYVIYQGAADPLVNIGGTTRMAGRFTELGYRHRYYVFPAAEHFTLAVTDEWTEAAEYMNRFRRTPDPPRVTYRVRPALEKAVEEVRTPVPLSYTFEGAYWVDQLSVRDGEPADPATMGTIDATSFGRGVKESVAIPEAGTAGQLTPYAMTGVTWLDTGFTPPADRFTADLQNLRTARLDLARMGIATGETIAATVTTDGPVAALRLAGSWASEPAVEGASSASFSPGLLDLSFDAAGTFEVTITPS